MWKTVWTGTGNNADGPVGTPDGGMMFAQNSNSKVMKLDKDGKVSFPYSDTNTGGAISMNKKGALFIVERGLPQQIWQLWADVAGWPQWNGDIERIELHGPFATGSRIVMTPVGEEPIELRIAEAVEPELFVDEAELGEVVVRTVHRVERLDGERARVTYRMEITGPAADTLGPQIGPEISGDFPETLEALVERAEA